MVLLSFSNDRGYVKTQIMRTFSPLFFYIVINYDIYSLLFNLRNEIHPKYWIKFGIIK